MSTYNFLPNGSFEDDTNWTLYNEAAYDTEHKVSGSRCLACSHNNFSGQQLQAIGYRIALLPVELILCGFTKQCPLATGLAYTLS